MQDTDNLAGSSDFSMLDGFAVGRRGRRGTEHAVVHHVGPALEHGPTKFASLSCTAWEELPVPQRDLLLTLEETGSRGERLQVMVLIAVGHMRNIDLGEQIRLVA